MRSIIDSNGVERFLGNNVPAGPTTRLKWQVYGDVPNAPMIPRSQWKPIDLRHLTPPTKDQDGIGACVTEDTEVLTASGWVGWPNYNWSDPIGTINQATGELEFQAPTVRHVYEYDGEMIYSTNRRLDFGVTPDHRMWVRKWDESKRTLASKYSFVTAENLGWYAGLQHAPTGFVGTELVRVAIEGDREYDGDDFISLVSLIVSDGYAGGSESTRNWVSFCNFRPERRAALEALAARTGFRPIPGRQEVWYRTDAAALANWVRANCYRHQGNNNQLAAAATDGEGNNNNNNSLPLGAPNKKVPEIVKWASARQIRLFLDVFGDQNHNKDRDGERFYSSSKRLVDDLQELLLRIGKRSSICLNQARPIGRVIHDHAVMTSRESYTLVVGGAANLCIDRKKHIERDRYKGLVYCATVPNSTMITRRNGSVLISGNCNAFDTCSVLESCRTQQGLKPVRLSPGWLYGNINGQQDQGSLLEDALEWAMKNGVCLASTVGELDWQQHKWPGGAAEEAKAYRMLEAFWCPTFDHLASAIQSGFFLSLGIMWGDNYEPDRDGWLPSSPRGGGGHAIIGCGLAERSGRWGLWMKNSWGAGWGIDGGYAVIPEAGFSGPVGGWWACRSVTAEQGDLPAPRVA